MAADKPSAKQVSDERAVVTRRPPVQVLTDDGPRPTVIQRPSFIVPLGSDRHAISSTPSANQAWF
jgi:hypothetical protein